MIEINEYYIYEWFIVDTQEVFYVGKGKGQRYKTLRNRNKYFLDMYDTHNCDVRIVYDGLSEGEAFAKEKELIAFYRSQTNYRLTNITDGGDGCSGWHPSAETRAKHSINSRIRWQDPDYRERVIADRHAPNSTYQSTEFKEKISKLVTGEKNPNYHHYWSDEQKQHLSQIRKEQGLAKKRK